MVEFKAYDPKRPQVITSFKGNQKLIFEGYRYNIHHIVQNKNLKTWRCVCAKKLTTHRSWCKGRAETWENDGHAISKGDHNHPAEHDVAELEFFKSQLLTAAVGNPDLNLNELIESAGRYMSAGITFPSRESLKKSLTVARKAAEQNSGQMPTRQYKSAEYKNGKPKTKKESNLWEDSLVSLTKGYTPDDIGIYSMGFDEAEETKRASPDSSDNKSDLSTTQSTSSPSSLHPEDAPSLDPSLLSADVSSPPSKMPKMNSFPLNSFADLGLFNQNLLMQPPNAVLFNMLVNSGFLTGSCPSAPRASGVPPLPAATTQPVRTTTPSSLSAATFDEKKARLSGIFNRLSEKKNADASIVSPSTVSESSTSNGTSTSRSTASPERKRTRSMSTQTEESREGSPLEAEAARLSKCLGGGCSCRVIQVCCCESECKRRRKSLSPKRLPPSSPGPKEPELSEGVSDSESVQASED
uniref:FLYWCH-type domain-containing protein n=1 Tax=Steinernema glaseri TaxID=37863 RepID=A0A1I7YVW7_9BILA